MNRLACGNEQLIAANHNFPNELPESLMLPPQSIESEQSVLGSILIAGSDALDQIEGSISDADFYHHDHREIFCAMRRLSNSNTPIDVITVAEELEGAGSLERIGGLPYLGSLAQNTPSAANIASYSKTVKKRALLRGLLTLVERIRADCYAPGVEVDEIINRADAGMVQLLDAGNDEPVTLYDALADTVADIDERATGSRQSGLQTGIACLDSLTGGLEPGQLIIIAARPSVGKTAAALNIADHVSSHGGSVAFFSLEMTNRDLSQRLLSMRSRVSVKEMRSGQVDEVQWSRISDCQGAASEQRLSLIDRPAVGIPYIRAAARRIKRKSGLDLIVVDYLALMKGEGQNRNQELGSITRGFKALAKELKVPIIALTQLNRGVEGRTDKRPLLSDLRDSGEIEQDADIVVMFHRESLYSNESKWSGLAELLVRKHRNGPIGEYALRFQEEYMRFEPYEGDSPRQVEYSGPPKRKGFS